MRRKGSVHSVATSASPVSDVHMLPDLLCGDERKVRGDGGDQGQTEAIQAAAPRPQNITCRRAKFKDGMDQLEKNKSKSSVRAKVEDVLLILRNVFGFDKVRYRSIAKNHNRLCANFALVNLKEACGLREYCARCQATRRRLWPFEHSRQPYALSCYIRRGSCQWPVVRVFLSASAVRVNLDRDRVQRYGFELDANEVFHLQLLEHPIQNTSLGPSTYPHGDGMPVAEPLRKTTPFAALLLHIKH